MINIGKKKISLNHKPVLISEISGNHGGKLSNAIKLIKILAKSGTDFIKIQTYSPDSLTLDSHKKDFIIKDKKSIWKRRRLYDLYSEGQTYREWHYKIFDTAKKNKVKCFSSIFDEKDIDFLEKFNVPAYKIASFESNHLPLIEKLIKLKKPILISTGLNTKKEIEELIELFKKKNFKKFALLKCSSSYPADLKNLNLSTISDMRKNFKCEVGFSDHTVGHNGPIAAIHNGASFIEKHVCINRKIGIDSKFSLEASKVKDLKNDLLKAHQTKGKIIYGPTHDEKLSLKFRRSIYSSKFIKKGEYLSNKNIKIIRPSYGLEPKYFPSILGKKVNKNIKFASPIQWSHIKNSKK